MIKKPYEIPCGGRIQPSVSKLSCVYHYSQPPMSFLRRQVGSHGIYGRRFKIRYLKDGFRKHRSQAHAQSSAGMTCSLKPALYLSFGAKHRQIPQYLKCFRSRKSLQRIQCFLQILRQQNLSLFYVFAVEDVVAKLEENAEVEAEIRDLSDLFGGSTNRHGPRCAAGTH